MALPCWSQVWLCQREDAKSPNRCILFSLAMICSLLSTDTCPTKTALPAEWRAYSVTMKMGYAVLCVLIYYVVVTCFKFENVTVWKVVHKPTQRVLNILKFKNSFILMPSINLSFAWCSRACKRGALPVTVAVCFQLPTEAIKLLCRRNNVFELARNEQQVQGISTSGQLTLKLWCTSQRGPGCALPEDTEKHHLPFTVVGQAILSESSRGTGGSLSIHCKWFLLFM